LHSVNGLLFLKSMLTPQNKYQYVELLIQPGQLNPSFTPQQYLQNRQIYSVDIYTSTAVNEARSNNPVATAAMIAGMYLNLYCTDVALPVQAIPNSTQVSGQGWGLWHRDVPLVRLNQVASPTDTYVRDGYGFYGELIDFEQSYVNITPTSAALIESAVVVVFGFGYK